MKRATECAGTTYVAYNDRYVALAAALADKRAEQEEGLEVVAVSSQARHTVTVCKYRGAYYVFRYFAICDRIECSQDYAGGDADGAFKVLAEVSL